MADKVCDVVLEGGGVKGIGLVGATTQIAEAGYRWRRVAGTSAGAIVGALLAAGMPPKDMVGIMESLDYSKFRDKGFIDNLSVLGQGASLAFEKGIYEGKYLREWLLEQLDKLGVRTFADLKLTEPWAQKLPPERRYKLVVIVSDVSRGRLVRLPWDYEHYGLEPDEQLVADAVRASMSIPFFYEPVNLKGNYIVDGGLLSNFPVGIFDDHNDWPTFGIKLSANEKAVLKMNPVTNPVNYTLAIMDTATNAHDQMHLDDPCTQQRTMFVDTFDIKATHFDITKEEQTKLFKSGQAAGKKFFSSWDYDDYQKTCPAGK